MRMFCNFSTQAHSLIILDEIDQLDKKEILYTLLEWSTLTNSRLILIGESEGQTCTCYSHAPLPFKYINSCDTVFNSCDTVYAVLIVAVGHRTISEQNCPLCNPLGHWSDIMTDQSNRHARTQ